MESRPLYIYERINAKGKKSKVCSLTENPALGTLIDTQTRLTADDGKLLTDGRITTGAVDTTTPEKWSEIDIPEPEDPEETTNE